MQTQDPTKVPRYRTLFEIARGGMGTVVLAARQDLRFLRLFALKRLHPHLSEDAGVRDMFMDEARLAGLIHHPNVVGVVDVGQDAEGPFLVMDYVDGVPLSQVIQHGPMPIAVVCKVAMHVAEGLHAAHELTTPQGEVLGIIHRDVSPQNILLGFDGIARLTDFGVARALDSGSQTRTGVLKGKMGYMAPERLRFETFDRRADLYALGVVVWEMLAGRRLYGGAEGSENARRILHEPTPDIGLERDDVPAAVVQLLFELLAKDKTLRPSTAQDVARVMKAVLDVLVEEGEVVELAEHLSRTFALLREERAQQIASALAAPQPDVASTSGTNKGTPRRWLWLAAGSGFATLALAAWLLSGRAETIAAKPDESTNVLPEVQAVVPPSLVPVAAVPKNADVTENAAPSSPKPTRTSRPKTKTNRGKAANEKLRLWQWK